MGRGVTKRDSTYVTPKVKLCMHTMCQVCCSKGLSGQSTIFGLFLALHEYRNGYGHTNVLIIFPRLNCFGELEADEISSGRNFCLFKLFTVWSSPTKKKKKKKKKNNNNNNNNNK